MATKGWSFGALTAALKSSAFLDAGQAAGQVALIAASNRVQTDAITDVSTGFRAAGIEQNDVTLYSNGSRPANGFSGSVKLNWYTNSVEHGLVRGAGTNSLGYATLYNGARKFQFLPTGDRHVHDGDNCATGGLVIGKSSGAGLDQAFSDWFRITATTPTEFLLQHTGASWKFTPAGSLVAGQRLNGGAGDAFVRAMVGSGSWDSWRARAPLAQVDLNGNDASTGIKWTQWGVAEVASISAANAGAAGSAIPTMEFNAGNVSMYLSGANNNNTLTLNSGGLTVAGNIVAGGSVYAGNGGGGLGADGNVFGPIWQGSALSTHLTNNFNDKATAVRGGAQVDMGVIGRQNPMWVPAGWFQAGMWANNNETIQNMRLLTQRFQVYKSGGGWMDSGV